MTLECECGKTVEDYRGARGHVKFKGGGPHGPAMQMPEDWKDLFTEIDGDDEQDDDGDDSEPVDRTTDRETDEAGPTPDSSGSSDEPDEQGMDTQERLRKALFEDASYLWR